MRLTLSELVLLLPDELVLDEEESKQRSDHVVEGACLGNHVKALDESIWNNRVFSVRIAHARIGHLLSELMI